MSGTAFSVRSDRTEHGGGSARSARGCSASRRLVGPALPSADRLADRIQTYQDSGARFRGGEAQTYGARHGDLVDDRTMPSDRRAVESAAQLMEGLDEAALLGSSEVLEVTAPGAAHTHDHGVQVEHVGTSAVRGRPSSHRCCPCGRRDGGQFLSSRDRLKRDRRRHAGQDAYELGTQPCGTQRSLEGHPLAPGLERRNSLGELLAWPPSS